ncbi:MAG: hypothetical protein QM640_13420 [Niabella sp.]
MGEVANNANSFTGGNVQIIFPIRFTGDAINHLSALQAQINLEEWVWHEEDINGQRHCIITDRSPAKR